MSNWFAIEDKIPPVEPVRNTRHLESKRVPVKIQGLKEVWMGKLLISGIFQQWQIIGNAGDWIVTDWYDIPDCN